MQLPAESERILTPIQIQVQSCLERNLTGRTGNGLAYRAKQYLSPSSKDVTEVEYATEWSSESSGRPSLSPATTKRYRDQEEADMAEMSSMSESEIQAVIVKYHFRYLHCYTVSFSLQWEPEALALR